MCVCTVNCEHAHHSPQSKEAATELPEEQFSVDVLFFVPLLQQIHSSFVDRPSR